MKGAGALVIAGLLAGGGVARGQAIIPIQRPGGEVGLEGAGLWVGFPQQTGLRRFDSWQWFAASVSGAVWDPRLLSFRAAIRPQWRQSALAGLPEPTDESAAWWGWDAGIALLPSSRLNASLGTVRSRTTLRAAFGTETRQRLTDLSARAGFRNAYLPLELLYRASDRDEYWLVGPREWRGQQLSLDQLRFAAQNRKIALTLERNWVTDRAAGTAYVLDRDDLRHTLAWGKGSRLSTRLGYLQQTGVRANRVSSWSEAAHLQHTRSISTDYRVALGSQRVSGSPVHTRLLDGSFSYQVAPGLRALAGGRSRSTAYAGGLEALQELQSRVDYRAALRPGVRLVAGLSVGYQWRRLEPSGEQWLAVADEPHVADATGRFSLDNPQVDPASVTLSSADRTLVYEPGLDYQQAEGAPSIEIFVLPGGRIAMGDTLLVSYRYQPFPASRAAGFTGGYDVDLSVHGFELYHRRTLRDVGNDGGAATGSRDLRVTSWLGGYRDAVVGARFAGRVRLGTMDFAAERVAREIQGGYRTTVYQVRGSLTVRLTDAVGGAVVGNASRTDATGAEPLTMLSASSSLSWQPVRSLRLQGTLATWEWTQDQSPRNGFLGGDLEVAWRPGLLSTEARYSHNVWREDARRTDDRLSLRMVRAF